MGERIRPRDVAHITGLSVRTVQELAVAGKVPSAAKLGGAWTFDPLRVRAWIRERERECLERAGEIPSTPTSVVIRTGDVSRLPDETIELAYEQLIRRKRPDGQRRGGKNSSASH